MAPEEDTVPNAVDVAGLDPKAAGLEPKVDAGLEPKVDAGLEPNAAGLLPKVVVGLVPNAAGLVPNDEGDCDPNPNDEGEEALPKPGLAGVTEDVPKVGATAFVVAAVPDNNDNGGHAA